MFTSYESGDAKIRRNSLVACPPLFLLLIELYEAAVLQNRKRKRVGRYLSRRTHPPMEQIMSGNGSKWLPVRNYDTRNKEAAGASKSF